MTNSNHEIKVSEEQEGFTSSLFSGSPVGVFSMEENGRLLQMNAAMAALLDCHEPYQKNMLVDLYVNEDGRQFFLEQLAKTGRAKDCSLQRKTKDGQMVLLSLEAFCLEKGASQRIIEGFVSDITSFQKVLEHVGCPAIRSQMQDQSTSLHRLAGGIAHEFNNMLGIIQGYTEMLLEEPNLDATRRHELKQIMLAAQRLVSFIARLLAYAGIQPHNPMEIAVNEHIEHRLARYEKLVGRGIQVLWYPENRLWNIFLDPAQLAELLAIFCTNARDAMNGLGTLTISTSNRHVMCESEELPPGDYVCVAVSDEGSGMPQTVLDHLYEPFFTTKNLGERVGLGLAAARGIVRQNSGHLAIKSVVGQGTSVIMHFPAVNEYTERQQRRE